MNLPQRFPHSGLPSSVTVYEVGARDGLQNEKTTVPTEVKAEFIERLADAGATRIEATSFVHPKWVPQLADAEVLYRLLEARPGVHYPVLVPNPRGLDRALACGVREIAVFASATETFAQRNLNTTVAGALADIAAVVRAAVEQGLWVRGYVSMCFGDPWEGPVAPDAVADVVQQLAAFGCDQISLGDTIGTGTPGHVRTLLDVLAARGIGPERLAVHFHDTYGQALANIHACLEMGVAVVDSSTSGLGGCPYAKGATGNVATEDVLFMLTGMGIATGVDMDKLLAAGSFISGVLNRRPESKLGRIPEGSRRAP